MKNLFNNRLFINLLHPFDKKKRRELRRNLSNDKKIEKLENFHKYAPLVLKQLSEAIQSYHKPVKIWLAFGTLLGAYREKNFIAHDMDIDLGIEEDDMTEDFIQHLNKKCFFIYRNFTIYSDQDYLNGFKSEYTFSCKENILIDIFVFKNSNGKKESFAFDREEGLNQRETLKKYNGKLRTIKVIFTDFDLVDIDFLGLKFSAPLNTQLHLSEVYGEDFMTPKVYDFGDRPKDHEHLLDNKTLGLLTYYK